VMGTVAYMSPEQLRGEPTNQSSDIFSVGIMLFEAITGQVPARAPDGGISASALNKLLAVQRPGLRADLHKTLLWCLADQLDERCSNAGEIQQQLVSALRVSDEGVPPIVSIR
jgi:serine/threonine-protein kinase